MLHAGWLSFPQLPSQSTEPCFGGPSSHGLCPLHPRVYSSIRCIAGGLALLPATPRPAPTKPGTWLAAQAPTAVLWSGSSGLEGSTLVSTQIPKLWLVLLGITVLVGSSLGISGIDWLEGTFPGPVGVAMLALMGLVTL